MARETFVLECLSILILIQLLQTSSESNNLQCNRSACGSIPVISDPFRLKGDPKSCGDSSYELVCENNTASVYLNSHKYHVKAINYDNFTIHLVDAEMKNDACSFPQYSLFENHFIDNISYSLDPYDSSKHRDLHKLTRPITFMSCPYPISSYSLLEIAHCGNRVFDSNASYSSTRRYTYVTVGDLKVSDVRAMCSIDVKVMTSWPFKDVKNLSLSDIHSSLLYGFELSWFTWTTCMDNKSCHLCGGNYGRETIEYCFGNVNYHWTWYVKWALSIVLQYTVGSFPLVYEYIRGYYGEIDGLVVISILVCGMGSKTQAQ